VQREYEEFKVRINALVAKAQKVPEDGWTMQDGTPWPGNSTRDHPGMIQVTVTHLVFCILGCLLNSNFHNRIFLLVTNQAFLLLQKLIWFPVCCRCSWVTVVDMILMEMSYLD